MNFAVLGAGAWGTAMAVHLQRLNHTVTLVPRRMEHALAIASARENADYLPGVHLPHSLQIGCELRPALMEAEVVLLACPSHALRRLCQDIAAVLDSSRGIRCLVILCKGLESESFLRPTQVTTEVLPHFTSTVLSGPSFAAEVANGAPTAITLAGPTNAADIVAVQEAMSSETFRVYRSEDSTGVELGGCLKNVYAIAAGICDGLQLGDNAKAGLLTRALAEMVRLAGRLGARPETLYGLSGFGDLVATCTSQRSRNHTFGTQLAKGNDPDKLIEEQRTVVEGYFATQAFYELCQRENLDAPILSEVYRVVYQGQPPAQALRNLMTRDLKRED